MDFVPVVVFAVILGTSVLCEDSDPGVARHWADFMAEIDRVHADPDMQQLLQEHYKQFQPEDDPDKMAVTCPGFPPSEEVPSSVHNLRPGDIKVVAAMGDSITAGNGINAALITGVTIQYRGYSWTVGGQSSIEEGSYTLPNILRLYNPAITGHSLGSGSYTNIENAQLNIAIPGAVAPGMPMQADLLVERMRNFEGVDYENDWKMVTLFIGGNDLCGYCNNRERYSVENYTRNIQLALDTYKAEMPRAFINVAAMFDVSPVIELGVGRPICWTFLQGACGCAWDEDNAREIKTIARQYSDSVEQLIASGRYDTDDDFTVVYQPFFRDNDMPRLPDGVADAAYFAPDCFHFNKRGHESAFRMLWEGLFQPVGEKSTLGDFELPLYCPQEDEIFATYLNSPTQEPEDIVTTEEPTTPTTTPTTVPTTTSDSSTGNSQFPTIFIFIAAVVTSFLL